MPLSVEQLITVVTSDKVANGLLQEFKSVGFNTARWHEGTTQRTFIEKLSGLAATYTATTKNIAEGGLLGLAQDLWLDLLGESFFRLKRQEATEAVHTVELTHSTGPNHSWSKDTLVVGTIATADKPAVQFRSIASGSISAGETKKVAVVCTQVGAVGSVSPDLIKDMVTPLTGVTVNNPADPTTGTSMTTVGVDKETNERYTRRCELRWHTLTYGVGPLAYEYWVLEADPTINRVSVLNPKGNGEVDIIAATGAGGITAEQITALTAYINDGRRPINDIPVVASASPYTVAIAASPTVRRGDYDTKAAAETAIKESWDAYFASLPIGGVIIAPSTTGEVLRDELIERAMTVRGVRRLAMTSPSGDTGLSSTSVPVGSYSLSITLESP